MTMIAMPALRISSRSTIDFYVRAFGAELVAAYPDTGDKVDHAELTIGGAMFMCGTGQAEGLEQPLGGASIYWVLDEEQDAAVDAIYVRAVDAGGDGVFPPYDADYGGRHCTVRDPDGNSFSFGTYRPEGSSPAVPHRA